MCCSNEQQQALDRPTPHHDVQARRDGVATTPHVKPDARDRVHGRAPGADVTRSIRASGGWDLAILQRAPGQDAGGWRTGTAWPDAPGDVLAPFLALMPPCISSKDHAPASNRAGHDHLTRHWDEIDHAVPHRRWRPMDRFAIVACGRRRRQAGFGPRMLMRRRVFQTSSWKYAIAIFGQACRLVSANVPEPLAAAEAVLRAAEWNEKFTQYSGQPRLQRQNSSRATRRSVRRMSSFKRQP